MNNMAKCDIIIPVWNQLDLTQQCITSIYSNTTYPYRLVIVDNASDEPTREYLNTLKTDPHDVVVIRNDVNEGFIKAVNKGIRMSNSEYICILNNDTIVTRNWLNEMIDVLDKNSAIGIVNPSSNSLGQKLPKGVGLEDFADSMRSHAGQYSELMTAIGFCMLFRRKLADKIGLLDETFGMGNFDDTDFSLRAKQIGYKCVRCMGAYVFHKESASFNIFKGFKKGFTDNRRIFEARWGRPQRILIAVYIRDFEPGIIKLIDQLIKDNNWVFISTTRQLNVSRFNNHSNLKLYNFNHFFNLFATIGKILFKKKRFDAVYTDSIILAVFCRMISLFDRSKCKYWSNNAKI